MRTSPRSVLLVVVGLLVGFTVGLIAAPESRADTAETYEALQRFADVLAHVQNHYVEDVDDEALIDGAIRGMLDQLDPHTVYMDPEQFAAMREDTSGEYVGVGMEISQEDAGFVIGTVFEGGPAFGAGVQSGDILVEVDGASTAEWTTEDVIHNLRGERGEPVTITVERSVEEVVSTIEFDLVRDRIQIDAVTEVLLGSGYGMVTIRSFQSNVGNEVRSAIDILESENGGELSGLILDLRGNPGGLLSEAISVSDAFLPSGAIVSTRGRWVDDDEEWNARRGNTRYTGPLVVLVNGSSASASEIVAGALQDNDRAVVIGTQTFGKGSVQSIIELDGGAGLKLTVSLYYTPDGRSIQNFGITPDLVVDASSIGPAVSEGVREADLEGTLDNPNGDEGEGDELDLSAIDDNQLVFAIQQLRAFDVFSRSVD